MNSLHLKMLLNQDKLLHSFFDEIYANTLGAQVLDIKSGQLVKI